MRPLYLKLRTKRCLDNVATAASTRARKEVDDLVSFVKGEGYSRRELIPTRGLLVTRARERAGKPTVYDRLGPAGSRTLTAGRYALSVVHALPPMFAGTAAVYCAHNLL